MKRDGYMTYLEIAEVLCISDEQARRIFRHVSKKFPGDQVSYIPITNVIPAYVKRIKMPELYRAMDYLFQTGKITPATIDKMLEIAGVDVEDRPTISGFLETSAKEHGLLEIDQPGET